MFTISPCVGPKESSSSAQISSPLEVQLGTLHRPFSCSASASLHKLTSVLFNLLELESAVAKGLLSAAEIIKKAASEGANSRRWKVGFVARAGMALIGVFGGLAAPFIAVGVGTVMGGLGIGGPSHR